MNTSQRTNEENEYVGQDVFLSHSGVQKVFVRQLYLKLKKEGLSCFFDESRESLPTGEKWPSLIIEAANKCRVAVLVLSMDFIQSKWPMEELSAFLKAKNGKNSKPSIIPLFFKISLDELKVLKKQDIPDWTKLNISKDKRDEWKKALGELPSYNGVPFNKGEDDDMSYISKIVREIRLKLPLSPRYFVSFIQGEERMCQEVEYLFRSVSSSGNSGVHIAGFYGVAGSGKTTLSKAFCNFNLKAFEWKVCHLDFQSGGPMERVRHALQYLTCSSEAELNSLPTKDTAWQLLRKKAPGQRVLLALDNITEDPEIVDEINVYTRAEFAPGSRILLSARSLKILQAFKCMNSCIHVPSLSEEEAISILLETTSFKESILGAEDRGFALKCAKRCCFKQRTADMAEVGKFHPLALKAFGRYLMDKFDADFSKWTDALLNLPRAMGDELPEVFTILEKSFNGMDPEYRTIFMLLAVYIPSKMSPDQALRWLAIVCNQEDNYIKNAVENLVKAAFIERIKPEIVIHDLLVEFAQKKANEWKKWLWVKGDSKRQLISKEDTGFDLIKFEGCTHQTPSVVKEKFLKRLLALQLVGMQHMEELDLRPMEDVRSISIHNCRHLQKIEGMDHLSNLAWLQIRHVEPGIKLSILSRLKALQYLEIEIPNYVEEGNDRKPVIQLGDLRGCVFLTEIYVRCPFLSEFPTIKGLQWLEKVVFSDCFNVTGTLDCTECSQLQSIELNFCLQMGYSPIIDGCSQLSRIILWQCDSVKECPEIYGLRKLQTFEICISSEAGRKPLCLDSCLGLNNLQLWNVGRSEALPDFSPLSRLTTLRLHRCSITESPKLTDCPLLEDVSFFTLKKLERFPKFSGLRALKKLCLCDCTRVSAPPDISGCSQLQVFHLLYNDNMEGLPGMSDCLGLEEIKLSWHASEQVTYEGIDLHSCNNEEEGDDLEFCLNYWKDETVKNSNGYIIPKPLKQWRWIQGKQMLVKRYVRGVKLYYSMTAPYEVYNARLTPPDEQHSNASRVTLKHRHCKVKFSPPQNLGYLTLEDIRDLNGTKWGHEWGEKVKRYLEEDIRMKKNGSGLNAFDAEAPKVISNLSHTMKKRLKEKLTQLGLSSMQFAHLVPQPNANEIEIRCEALMKISANIDKKPSTDAVAYLFSLFHEGSSSVEDSTAFDDNLMEEFADCIWTMQWKNGKNTTIQSEKELADLKNKISQCLNRASHNPMTIQSDNPREELEKIFQSYSPASNNPMEKLVLLTELMKNFIKEANPMENQAHLAKSKNLIKEVEYLKRRIKLAELADLEDSENKSMKRNSIQAERWKRYKMNSIQAERWKSILEEESADLPCMIKEKEVAESVELDTGSGILGKELADLLGTISQKKEVTILVKLAEKELADLLGTISQKKELADLLGTISQKKELAD